MNLINNAQAAIEKAIRHFRCMADDARIVLDSGFGTHPGECDLLYRNRKLYAELAIAALEEQQRRRWIPVEARLPGFNAFNPITRDPCVYPVTIDLGGITDIRYYSFWKGHWYKQGPKIMDDLVIAWQPLPEPYKPEKGDK